MFFKLSSLFVCYITLLFNPAPLFGQNEVTIHGRVIDSHTNLPLPYATIRLQGKPIGTISGTNGFFNLTLPAGKASETLLCSAIGYTQNIVKLDTLQSDSLHLALTPTSFIMDEVVVYANQSKIPPPEKMVKKAIGKLTKTCPPYQADARLKHYILENGSYVKYTEADLTIKDAKGYGRNLNPLNLNEQITWTEKRESMDMLNDLLADYGYFANFLNPFRFLLHNALKYKFALKNHVFSVKDTLLLNDQKGYIVTAKGRENPEKFADWYDMRFYMLENPADMYDYNLIRFEINFQSDETTRTLTHAITSSFSIDLCKQGSYFQPAKIEYIMFQNKYWENNPEMSVKYTVYYALDFDQVDFNVKDLRNISAANNKYDAGYWRAKPLDKKLIDDLSIYLPLEKQFALQADKKQMAQVQDSLDMLKYKKVLEAAKGKKNIYVLVWDDWQTLMHFQQPKNWPIREDIVTIFVGNLQNRANWAFIVTGINAIYFKNFDLPFSWDKILKEPANNTLPAYVIIHKDGQISYSSTPFSQEYLDGLD